MKPSIEKLYKILNHEIGIGFKNLAVVGGIEKLVETWENEARSDGLPETLIEPVVGRLRDYKGLSEKSRPEAIQGLWRLLQRLSNEDVPGLMFKKQKTSISQPSSQGKKTEPVDSVGFEQSIPRPTKKKNEIEEVQIVSEEDAAALNAPITVLDGVGPKYAKSLERLEIKTLGDALFYYPRDYVDYSTLKPISKLWYGEKVTIIGVVSRASVRSVRGGKLKIVEAIVTDGSGSIRVNWFNQPWVAEKLKGTQVRIAGKIEQYLGRLVMNNPEWEFLDRKELLSNRILPIYPLTGKISQRWLRRILRQVVEYWSPKVYDPLPSSIRKDAELFPLSTSLRQIHSPDSLESLEQARHRLAFDEIFFLQIGVLLQRHKLKLQSAKKFDIPLVWLTNRKNQLPFALTEAQSRAVHDIRGDLQSGSPMNRLLQGDVGSGKTVVAALAIEMITNQGSQAALMAPTSILAEQHLYNMRYFLYEEGKSFQENDIRLLIGSTPEKEKQEIRDGLKNGEVKLVIGTHALIEPNIEFLDLQLIIVDEQHRFGVQQRAALREKGETPHMLVMTATPIPRSLALSVYGDLDLSVMDEMPPGRQEIKTFILSPLERERAYTFIRRQIEMGHQAFMIFPLVEEQENIDARAAVEEHARLQKIVFPNFRLGLLHGRMKADEKDDVMSKFRAGAYDILVSTSVVEVGVDVPNATIMLVEGANRFGLAQLHQFRGRVGRGKNKSFCLLIPESSDAIENERLRAMVGTNDGFKLAEIDLDQRGPGDFLGTRQSGYAELKMASLTNVALIEKARYFAKTIFENDPNFDNLDHQPILKAVENFWTFGDGDIS